MTEEGYKRLQSWCKMSWNKKDQNYKFMVEWRNEATSIRRQIIFSKTKVKQSVRILLQCKDEDSKAKWSYIVEESKKIRDDRMKKFAEFPEFIDEKTI